MDEKEKPIGRHCQRFYVQNVLGRHFSLLAVSVLSVLYLLACQPGPAEAIGQIPWEYHDYAMLQTELDEFHTRWPNLSRVYTIGTSVKEREMYVLEISDNPGIHEIGKK